MNMGNRPIKKWRSGAIEAAVFLNEREVEGNKVGFKTLALSRSYKKKGEDIWRSDVLNLRRSDLSKILAVLNEANKYLFLENNEKESEEDE